MSGLVSGTRRTVTSDTAGRFSLRMRVGSYLITPLPQQHTHGGERVVIEVRAGESTAVAVRFVGFPQMALP